ncbi:MAG: SufE family protein [Pseudomonadota bacterium]
MAHADFEEIVETFEFLDDWEDRYRHVIELGRAMPEMDAALKVPATKVEGCASQVWLHDGGGRALSLQGDSDAMIVKGLIAVLLALYNGLTPEEAAKVDVRAELGRLNLTEHLSSQRSNGLKAMVQRIQETAAKAA